MTASTVQLCRCGHAEQRHTDDEGCDRGECGCASFRAGRLETFTPPTAVSPSLVSRPPAPQPARPATAPPTIEQILTVAERSPKQGTRTKAVRLRQQIDGLRKTLMQERADAETDRRETARREAQKRAAQAAREQTRREVAELEAKLKAARARLVGNRATASTKATAPTDHACTRDGCDRTFTSGQARAMHERRAHDGFDPTAAKASA